MMSPLESAVDCFGSAAKLARALDVSPMSVSNWKKRGVPVKRAKQIERITDGRVKAGQLRPDIFDDIAN